MNETDPLSGKGLLWGPTLAIAAGHFLHDVFSSFYAPLLPLLRDRLSMSYETAGVLSVFQRVPSLANPFLGALADRMCMRRLLVAAPLVTAGSMTLIGLVPSKVLLALVLLLGGVGSALWHVPAPVVLARVSRQRVGMGMSFFMLAGEGARAAGPILCLSAVSLFGPGGLPLLLPLAFLGSFLVWRATRPLVKDAEERRKTPKPKEPWRPLVRLLAPLAALVVGRSFLTKALGTFLPALVVARGGSLWLGGAALAILRATSAAGSLLTGTLSDRWGRKRMVAALSLLAPALMILMVLVPPWMMFPCLVLLGLVAFSDNPVLLALVQEKSGSRPAVANGIFLFLGFPVRSLAVVAVGAAADAWGLERAFLWSGVAGFLALAGALALPGAGSGKKGVG